MKSSPGLQLLLFFVLVAALLVHAAMGIHPKAPAEVATICSAGAPARSVQAQQPLPRAATSPRR